MLSRKPDLLLWLSIIKSHSIFQFGALAFKEKKYIKMIMQYGNYMPILIDKIEKKSTWKNLFSIPKVFNKNLVYKDKM